MNTILIANEMIVEYFVRIIAGEVPYAKVIRAIECTLIYLDAFRVVCICDVIVI